MSARQILLGLCAIVALSACKTKPSAAVYSGDGPSIHYTSTEAAGGPMKSSKYR
jgi:hypothetical protein